MREAPSLPQQQQMQENKLALINFLADRWRWYATCGKPNSKIDVTFIEFLYNKSFKLVSFGQQVAIIVLVYKIEESLLKLVIETIKTS